MLKQILDYITTRGSPNNDINVISNLILNNTNRLK